MRASEIINPFYAVRATDRWEVLTVPTGITYWALLRGRVDLLMPILVSADRAAGGLMAATI